MNLVIIFIVFMILPLAELFNQYRKTKVAKARLGITKCVNRIYELQSSGTIKKCDAMHDYLFHTMERTQYSCCFELLSEQGLTEKNVELSRTLKLEIETVDWAVRSVVEDYIRNVMLAVVYSNPIGSLKLFGSKVCNFVTYRVRKGLIRETLIRSTDPDIWSDRIKRLEIAFASSTNAPWTYDDYKSVVIKSIVTDGDDRC